MHTLIQDLRYGARMLAKNPGLTLVIVLSLAIGIGANTAIFSVTSTLLLKPLPYPHPDRLAILWLRSPGIGIPQDWPSRGQYHDIKTQNHVFEDTAIAIGDEYILTGLSKAIKVACYPCWAQSRCWAASLQRTKTGRASWTRWC